MQPRRLQSNSRGFSFIELLVTAAVTTLVFGGIMASVQFALKIISTTKAKTGAISLAVERIEYIRSLSYADAGTAGGIPDGPISQNATTSLNGTLYHERVLIQYVDSPEDGLGGSDTNGILADFKEARIEYSWATPSGTSTVFLLTNIVPPGIESTDGGGTLAVNVFDAGVLPVSGASVRVYNDTTTTTIDTTRLTNVDGIAMFSGAPAAGDYQITVTKLGYSTDRTYSATTTNPTPITPHVAVVESTVSTMNFQIDELSDLLVRTIGPSTNGTMTDSFDDATLIGTQTDTVLETGAVVLAGGVGTYSPSGTVHSTSTEPSTITAWDTADWTATVPVNTTLLVQVYSVDGSGTYTLIPDGDIPGNSVGFAMGPVSLSGLNTGTYDALALGATLATTDSSVTPSIESWSIGHIINEPAIGSVPFTLTGAKIIGTGPVYKYDVSHTTNSSGERQITDLEWDSYGVSLDTGAYDISQACSNLPYLLDPGVSDTLTLTLVPAVTDSLRVSVVDIAGNPITGANVGLSRTGFSDSGVTSTCGQVFFNSGISANTDFELDVDAVGYTSQNVTSVEISGSSVYVVTMVAS